MAQSDSEIPAGALNRPTLNRRIEDFITWASALAVRSGRPHEVIPEDPHGAVGTERFRRTLAWYIARRPGGLIAPSRAAATALAIHAAGLPTTFEDTVPSSCCQRRRALCAHEPGARSAGLQRSSETPQVAWRAENMTVRTWSRRPCVRHWQKPHRRSAPALERAAALVESTAAATETQLRDCRGAGGA
ncbi:hypothetical protein [Streptomyces sp. NBC_01615]|uniref:hypothetical protein n=1 Tax=Streptomyces sp. NBC_01615 TaxID=2975898 RepID=UPI0038679324